MAGRFDQTWKRVAIGLALASATWFLYDGLIGQRDPALDAQSAADRAFEDGDYDRALSLYRERTAVDARNAYALRGIALSLMQLGSEDEALRAFADAIDADPEFGGAYANRGILHDRMGSHEEAVADYQRALALDPELADGQLRLPVGDRCDQQDQRRKREPHRRTNPNTVEKPIWKTPTLVSNRNPKSNVKSSGKREIPL